MIYDLLQGRKPKKNVTKNIITETSADDSDVARERREQIQKAKGKMLGDLATGLKGRVKMKEKANKMKD